MRKKPANLLISFLLLLCMTPYVLLSVVLTSCTKKVDSNSYLKGNKNILTNNNLDTFVNNIVKDTARKSASSLYDESIIDNFNKQEPNFKKISQENGWIIDKNLITKMGWDTKTKILESDFARDFPNAFLLSDFNICRNLEYIELPKNIKIIDDRAFQNLINLKTVKHKNSVLFYGSKAFNKCSNLDDLPISNNTLSIYENAFSNCRYSPKIKKLPSSIMYLGHKIFNNLINFDAKNNKLYPNSGMDEFNNFEVPSSLLGGNIDTLLGYDSEFIHDKKNNKNDYKMILKFQNSNHIFSFSGKVNYPLRIFTRSNRPDIKMSYDKFKIGFDYSSLAGIDFRDHFNFDKYFISEDKNTVFFKFLGDSYLKSNSNSKKRTVNMPNSIKNRFDFIYERDKQKIKPIDLVSPQSDWRFPVLIDNNVEIVYYSDVNFKHYPKIGKKISSLLTHKINDDHLLINNLNPNILYQNLSRSIDINVKDVINELSNFRRIKNLCFVLYGDESPFKSITIPYLGDQMEKIEIYIYFKKNLPTVILSEQYSQYYKYPNMNPNYHFNFDPWTRISFNSDI